MSAEAAHVVPGHVDTGNMDPHYDESPSSKKGWGPFESKSHWFEITFWDLDGTLSYS